MHSSTTVAVEAEHRNVNLLLWGLQSALALTFVVTGTVKLILPVALVVQYLPWSADMSEPMIRGLAALELAAVWGLMVPGLTRTATQIVSATAWLLAVMMACAIFFHLARNEGSLVVLPTVLGAVSVFVAWGRSKLPITPLEG